MTEEARRRIIYAIARSMGRTPTTVYSFSAGEHTQMSGSGTAFYDHGSGAHFSDKYDFESSSHWKFDVTGTDFTGYNFGSSDHFSGSIKNGAAQFYDYGTSGWYHYSV